MFFKIFVSIIAGLGAGVATGLAGLSAATVISPILIGLLDMSSYDSMIVALSSDVLASAASAAVYGKHKNIDIKHGSVMAIAVVLMTIAGSYVGSLVPTTPMGFLSILSSTSMGLRFLFFPNFKARKITLGKNWSTRMLESAICGIWIGFVCGFIGVGGGMMMLFVLTIIMGYPVKQAVGTSVFIMTFAALTGAVSHIALSGLPDLVVLCTCIAATLVGAQVSSMLANRSSTEKLNRIVGWMLLIIGVFMFIMNLF